MIQIQESQLREFISNGAVTHIEAVGNANGFELRIHIGAAIGSLANARGTMRTFSSLNTLAGLGKRLGAGQFEVVIGDFSTAEALPAKVSTSKSSPTKTKNDSTSTKSKGTK